MGPLRRALNLLPWNSEFNYTGLRNDDSPSGPYAYAALWTAPVPAMLRRPLPADMDGAYVALNTLLDAADALLAGGKFEYGGAAKFRGRLTKWLFRGLDSAPPEYHALMSNMQMSHFLLINAVLHSDFMKDDIDEIADAVAQNSGLVPLAFWLVDLAMIHLNVVGRDIMHVHGMPLVAMYCVRGGAATLLRIGDMRVGRRDRRVIDALARTVAPGTLRRCHVLNDEGVAVPSDKRRICRMMRMLWM